MNKKEVRESIVNMLSAGQKKQEVFNTLSGKGVKDRLIAYWIASYADPRRCAENAIHRRILIVIACVQLLIGFLIAFSLGMEISATVGWITALLAALLGGMFIWAFAKNKVNAYNVFILLSITQFPRALNDLHNDPVPTIIGMAIGLALVAYVWFVRSKIFPDFFAFSPRKMNGRYVFTD